MGNTEKSDLLGELKKRVTEATDAKRREEEAQRQANRREAEAQRQLRARTRRLAIAVRLAKGLCIDAAWQQQKRAAFPESLEEFKDDIAQSLGVVIENPLGISDTKPISQIVSIVERLEPILVEFFGEYDGLSLFYQLVGCTIDDDSTEPPSKEIRDAFSKKLEARDLISSEIRYACKGLRNEFNRNPNARSQIERFLKHEDAFWSACFGSGMHSWWAGCPPSNNEPIMLKQLELIGLTVSDANYFVKLAGTYKNCPTIFLDDDNADYLVKLDRLNTALREANRNGSENSEELLSVLDKIYSLVKEISKKETKKSAQFIFSNDEVVETVSCGKRLLRLLDSLDSLVEATLDLSERLFWDSDGLKPISKYYLSWENTSCKCSALLDWLSSDEGQALREDLIAYFRNSADAGLPSAMVTASTRSSKTVISLTTRACDVDFPGGIDDIALMLESFCLPMSSKKLKSGETHFEIAWQ